MINRKFGRWNKILDLNEKISIQGARIFIILFTWDYLYYIIIKMNLCRKIKSEKTLKLNSLIVRAIRYPI